MELKHFFKYMTVPPATHQIKQNVIES